MSLVLRPVVEEDRARVCEISAQIWDGEDYVPNQFDDWLTDSEGAVIGAELDGTLIAFARRTWLLYFQTGKPRYLDLSSMISTRTPSSPGPTS